MTVIKLEALETKPDLVVEYKGQEYVLPGTVSAETLTDVLGNQADPEAMMVGFLNAICPPEFKKALAVQDIPKLMEIWSDYVNGPKELPSAI